MMMMKYSEIALRRFKGFTLIELLVVIAIICILAAILFPVFATARDKARQSACLSNEKQIGLAIVQYSSDYDETFPNGDFNGGNMYGWIGRVYPYVKSTAAFDCPSESFTPSPIAKFGGHLAYADAYVYNTDFATSASSIWTGQALSKVTAPDRSVIVWEWNAANSATTNISQNPNYFDPTNDCPDASIATPSLNYCSHGSNGTNGGGFWEVIGHMDQGGGIAAPQLRHGGGGNFILADGHVKFLQAILVSAGKNAASSVDKHAKTAGLAEGAGYIGTGQHSATMSVI